MQLVNKFKCALKGENFDAYYSKFNEAELRHKLQNLWTTPLMVLFSFAVIWVVLVGVDKDALDSIPLFIASAAGMYVTFHEDIKKRKKAIKRLLGEV